MAGAASHLACVQKCMKEGSMESPSVGTAAWAALPGVSAQWLPAALNVRARLLVLKKGPASSW